MRKLKGFTLIEVLIVIAIILILAAIMFPVMGIVKGRAKKTQCTANLHQIGMALNFYMADNDWHIPVQYDDRQTTTKEDNKAISLFAKSLRTGRDKLEVICPLRRMSYNFPFQKFNSDPNDTRVTIAECTDSLHAKPESVKAILGNMGAVPADGLMLPTRLCITINVKDPSQIKVDYMERPMKFNFAQNGEAK